MQHFHVPYEKLQNKSPPYSATGNILTGSTNTKKKLKNMDIIVK